MKKYFLLSYIFLIIHIMNAEADFLNHPDVRNYIEKSGGTKVAIESLKLAEKILDAQRAELKETTKNAISWFNPLQKQLMQNKKDRKKVKKILFCLLKHVFNNLPKDINIDTLPLQEKK